MSRSKPHKLRLFLVTRGFHVAKYLGRQFYELLGEERFDEEKFASSTFLNRPATANASPEFTQHLVKSLEVLGGKPSGGNGATEWLLDEKDLSAKLSYKLVSAEGPFLSLVIDSK